MNNKRNSYSSNFVIRFLAFCLIISGGTACSSRNLRRGITFSNPPLQRIITLNTHDAEYEAGENPVEFGRPVLTQNIIYLPSHSRGLEALDRTHLSRKWVFPVKNGLSSEVLLLDDVLYFGGNDGVVYGLKAETGKLIWSYETKTPVWARPTVSKNRIYFTASDDVIYCLDVTNGKWVWHYKRGVNFVTTVHGNSVPVVDNDRVYAGFSDGYFVALNAKDGNLLWETRIHHGTKFTDVDAEAVIDENRIYISAYDGELYALERSNGKVIWHTNVGGSKKVVLEDKILYVPSSDGFVYAIQKDNGRLVWKFALDLGTPTNLILHGTYLAFGSSRQYFYVIHKGNGELAYRFNAGLRSGFLASPIEDEQGLFILSNFGNLYGFRWITELQKRRMRADN